jgi:hypothetical protein
MTLIQNRNMGFLRHDSRGGIDLYKRGRKNKSPPSIESIPEPLVNAIPPEVAPQQSFNLLRENRQDKDDI